MRFLELENVQKAFGASYAVQHFDLSVERGEFISFLGPSGCGKTTTLRMVAGFELPSTGQIRVDGKDITNLRPNQRNIGMVFQSYALFPNMTVAENVAFGLKVARRSPSEIEGRVGEMLKIIKLPQHAGRYPYQLSGGQQQRIALARALAYEPQVLLLDEPLSALDAKIRVALRVEIRSIQRQLGITTVYVTHDQEEALSLSDRVVVMSEGRIEQIGTPFEIYNFPSTSFVASFVGTLNVMPASVVDAARGELTVSGQPVRLARRFGGGAGRAVQIALRPEMASLGEGPDGSNRVSGKVVDVSFLGSIVRIRASLSETGPVVVLDEFNEPTLKLPTIGDTVTISFPTDGPLVLDSAPLPTVDALIAEEV